MVLRRNKCEASTLRTKLLSRLEEAARANDGISADMLCVIANETGCTTGEAYGVSTFYSYLHLGKRGKNIIRICQCAPCEMKNSKLIADFIYEELGIAPGEISEDGCFSMELVSCIGACDHAPAMLINDDLHVDLTQEKVRQLLKDYR